MKYNLAKHHQHEEFVRSFKRARFNPLVGWFGPTGRMFDTSVLNTTMRDSLGLMAVIWFIDFSWERFSLQPLMDTLFI